MGCVGECEQGRKPCLHDCHQQGAPMRGVVIGVLISLALWIAVLAVWMLVKGTT